MSIGVGINASYEASEFKGRCGYGIHGLADEGGCDVRNPSSFIDFYIRTSLDNGRAIVMDCHG